MLFPLPQYLARKGIELSVNKEKIVTRDGQYLLKKTSCLLIKISLGFLFTTKYVLCRLINRSAVKLN